MVDLAIGYLNGDISQVTKQLKNDIQKASDQLNFEKAARFRDVLKDMKSFDQRPFSNLKARENLGCNYWLHSFSRGNFRDLTMAGRTMGR